MTINILGLGESLSRYIYDENKTIGVNDIWKKVQTNYLVCVDRPSRFEPERLEIIKTCKPEKFFSHITEWKQFHENYEHIDLCYEAKLDSEQVRCSNNSTFVACIMAFRLGAKNIQIYGADFKTHKTLQNEYKQFRILRDFGFINSEFKAKGVKLCCTKESILSQILESF